MKEEAISITLNGSIRIKGNLIRDLYVFKSAEYSSRLTLATQKEDKKKKKKTFRG